MPGTFRRFIEGWKQDPDTARRRWLDTFDEVLTFLPLLVGIGLLALVVFDPVPPPAPVAAPNPAAVRACDRAVAALLESRDPVELQRAGLLIGHLRCDVERRLPAPG